MMTPEFDPYDVLGVKPGATLKQVRAAYLAKVSRYHPDKHRGNPLEELASEKLRAINRAYEMLSNGMRARDASRGGEGSGDDAVRRSRTGAVRSAKGPPDVMARLAGTAGMALGALFLLRFGMGLIREVWLLVRAAAVGILWLVGVSPIFLIALVLGLAMLTGYWLKVRHRER
jgi:hypothetical protein